MAQDKKPEAPNGKLAKLSNEQDKLVDKLINGLVNILIRWKESTKNISWKDEIRFYIQVYDNNTGKRPIEFMLTFGNSYLTIRDNGEKFFESTYHFGENTVLHNNVHRIEKMKQFLSDVNRAEKFFNILTDTIYQVTMNIQRENGKYEQLINYLIDSGVDVDLKEEEAQQS